MLLVVCIDHISRCIFTIINISFTMASPSTPRDKGLLAALPSMLPEGTSHVEFTSVQDIQSLVDLQITKYQADNFSSPFLVISNIPVNILQEFDQIYVDKGPRITVDLKSRILILETMVLEPHETFSRYFEYAMYEKLKSMGLESSVIAVGASRVHYGDFIKEPDASWRPIDRENPTIVLETGLSEKSNQLAIEAQAWLEADGSKTKAAITACIDRREPLITVNLWEKCPKKRPVTRSHKNLMGASKRLDISIRHKDGRTTVSRDLTVSFETLMDRPSNTTWETDMLFTQEELEGMAEMAWKCQNFM